jgi:four helix bundle protein
MSKPLGFRDLDVWKRGMDLVVDVYRLTRAFPRSELYGLTDQARRAASSVPANVAEGNGRLYRKEYAHHVSIARGSVAELSTCLEIAQRLGYVSPAVVAPLLKLADDVSRMLLMLARALERPTRPPSRTTAR